MAENMFDKYRTVLSTELAYAEDDTFSWKNVVGLLIIQLKNTDSINKQSSASHATQIQITSEREASEGRRKTEDFFPTLTLNTSFKSWRISIPVFIHLKNIELLGGATSVTDDNWKPDTIQIRRRLLNENESGQGNPNLQMCYGDDIMPLREHLYVNDYLVVAKCKEDIHYYAFGVKGSTDLGEGKNMYLSPKAASDSTAFSVETLVSDNRDDLNARKAKGGVNRIYYGAPGCGKSHYVTDLLIDASVPKENIIRVTFHPEYANCDFIGQILPTIEKDDNGEERVKYIFNPGPFSLALLKAYNTTDMVYLIVEEINRGNAAAIFGDMFQLLDRVRDIDKPDYSASEYPVSNPNMQAYLQEEVKDPDIRESLCDGVFIPSNLTVYATMNSSDQNVFTLDTAFKRRWNFEQISNDITRDTDHKYKKWFIPGTNVTWEAFLTALNNRILDYKIHSQTNEDKRLGKYFVTKECLTENVENITDVQDVAMEFAYKVLEYVWNDVCKIGREDWFDTERYRTLEDVIEGFINPRNGETPLSIFQNITF